MLDLLKVSLKAVSQHAIWIKKNDKKHPTWMYCVCTVNPSIESMITPADILLIYPADKNHCSIHKSIYTGGRYTYVT
jgi:hypothetical protein